MGNRVLESGRPAFHTSVPPALGQKCEQSVCGGVWGSWRMEAAFRWTLREAMRCSESIAAENVSVPSCSIILKRRQAPLELISPNLGNSHLSNLDRMTAFQSRGKNLFYGVNCAGSADFHQGIAVPPSNLIMFFSTII